MSLLATKLRGVLFSNLRPDMPQALRNAAWNLFDAIDTDLDIAEYTDNESSTTQEAVEKFDLVLQRGDHIQDDDDIEYDDDIEDEDTPIKPDPLNLELDEDDDIT
jgi:hypothetical protein